MLSSEDDDEVWARAASITNQAIQGCKAMLERAVSFEDSPLSVVVREAGLIYHTVLDNAIDFNVNRSLCYFEVEKRTE